MKFQEIIKLHFSVTGPPTASVPRSCKDISPSSGDGNYSIDPRSSGNPITVYCDMTTDGGKNALASDGKKSL